MALSAMIDDRHAGRRRDAGEVSWLGPPHDGMRAGARLLEADPDLGRVLHPLERDRLDPLLRVRVEVLDVGVLKPSDLRHAEACLGLLVLEGLLLRELSVCGRRCAELLGPGDLLRPWSDPAAADGSVLAELEWQVVDGPLRMAVLDRRASALIGRFPVLVSELLDRTLARAGALQFQLALTQIHGVDQRLELLLWHLADRWGRMTLDGAMLHVRLTHEMLGRLIGARRPSVTTALRRLSDAGAVLRRPDGWLLREDPRDRVDPRGGPADRAVTAG